MTDGEEVKEEEVVELTDMGLRAADEPLTAQRGTAGVDEREGRGGEITAAAGAVTVEIGEEEEEVVVVWVLSGTWLNITCSAGLLGNLRWRWWRRGRLPGQDMGRCFSHRGEVASQMSSSASESSSSPVGTGGSLVEVSRVSSGLGCSGVAVG